MGPGFQFNVLGALEVRRDGQPVPVRAAKQRALLAALLVDANQVVPIDTLVDRLWDERVPGGVRNTLQNYVLRLRRTLGGAGGTDGPVSTHAAGYRITVDDGACDLHRFDALAARARHLAGQGEVARASAVLREATGLWRAEPLLDVPSERLRREVVPALVEKRLDAIEFRIGLDVELGRHGDVLPELRELTAAHPWRERLWAQRVLALYRAGRQGDAVRCYHDVREVLAAELGISPGAELTGLFQRVLAADPDLLRGVPDTVRAAGGEERRPDAGETTAFVGRRHELAHLRRLLESHRLVTLTGVAGAGKSRLARRLAAEHGPGTRVVDLSAADGTLTAALGLTGITAVAEHLREVALLVLDNGESSADDLAEEVTALLRASPGVRVLVTTRHRLGLPGEHVVVLGPMSRAESAELLLDRASAAVPGFVAALADRRDVEALCDGLDGVPLALELAALRLGVLSVRDAAERVGDRFRLLDDRLRRSVARSWDLCSEAERSAWTVLAGLRGEFDLAEAERVCVAHGIVRADVVELVAGLVHKSVLGADTGGPRTRYEMLGMLRDYGLLRSADLTPRVPRLRSVAD